MKRSKQQNENENSDEENDREQILWKRNKTHQKNWEKKFRFQNSAAILMI